MKQPTILVVEDNPITRKMVRLALQAESYRVIEAESAHAATVAMEAEPPDLVLQDLLLPDQSGLELVGRLRRLPGGAELPILAFSGAPSKLEEARLLAAGFTDYILKPVEPSTLIETVQGYLPRQAPADNGRGRRLLVVDDDPIQLKFMRLRLAEAGYQVVTATDGAEALHHARTTPLAAIVTDIVMPRLDGFSLCLEVRQDPRLLELPVVLVTSTYIEEADRDLAGRVGASAYVVRTPDLRDLLTALDAALDHSGEPPTATTEAVAPEFTHRLVRQLEHQAAMSTGLARRCTLLAAELAVLNGVADALAQSQDVHQALKDILALCLDAGGVSLGAVYLLGHGGELELRAYSGYGGPRIPDLQEFFGQGELLRQIVDAGATVIVPSEAVPEDTARALLDRAGLSAAVVAPITAHGEKLGALVMAVRSGHVLGDDQARFARTVAVQLGQAVALTNVFARLGASELRYRSLFELSPLPTWILDAKSLAFLAVNEAAVSRYGYAREEFVGLKLGDVLAPDSARGPSDGASEPEKWKGTVAARHRTKRGETIDVEVSAHRLVLEGRDAWIVSVRDVTEQRLLEDQLRQAQKMEAVGRLAGGIAHDFNNVITVINGYSDLVLKGLPAEVPLRPEVEEIRRAGDRAASLTRQLLAFGRKQILAPRVIDVNAVVANLERMLRRLIGEDIELVTALDPNLGRTRADPGQLEQAILNLVTNARDAMPDGGKLTIETAGVVLDEASARQQPELQAGPFVLVAVHDTGTGMDAETQARIFEPFFSTKELGKGTGLGLSTVYGIVAQSGGNISVSSEPGRGTTFKIYLPRVDEPLEEAPREPATGTVPRGAETLLVTEDEAGVRELVRRALEQRGYTVLVARDGAEAQLLAAEYRKPIHLLVTDMVMPGMNGRDLAEQIAAARPDIRVLFLSGYASDVIARQGVLEKGLAFLQKPFTPDDLACRVREVLDR